MSWLSTLRWIAGVAAAVCVLLAIYVWDVRGDPRLAGVMGFVALFFGFQWVRIGGWQRRLDAARDESE